MAFIMNNYYIDGNPNKIALKLVTVKKKSLQHALHAAYVVKGLILRFPSGIGKKTAKGDRDSVENLVNEHQGVLTPTYQIIRVVLILAKKGSSM